MQPAYSECLPQRSHLQTTERLAAEIVSLPLYPELSDREVEWVIEAVTEAGMRDGG